MGVPGEHARDEGVPPLRRWSFWGRVLAAWLRQAGLFLVAFLLLTVPHPDAGGGRDPGRARPDEAPPTPAGVDLAPLLRALEAKDDAAVLAFFTRFALDDRERATVAALIGGLGSESFARRERAERELRAWGLRASAALRRAAGDPDPEVARRARGCADQFGDARTTALLTDVCRQFAERRPAGTAAALLEFLPDAPDERVAEAARAAITATAVREGKADEAVVRALNDPRPERRAAAGAALCQSGGEPHRSAVCKLLDDRDPAVRHRVSLALVAVGEKEALGTLIGLLGELGHDEAWPAIDLLSDVAGTSAPAVPPGRDAAGRRRCRDAWSAWWREHGPRADLSRVATPTRGPTLIVEMDLRSLNGRVIEVGPEPPSAGRPAAPLRSLEGLHYPLSAQPLPGGRVLVAEYVAERVTERDFRGEELGTLALGRPVLYAERLPGGNVFVAFRNGFAEVRSDGEEVFAHRRPTREVVAARPLAGGGAVLIASAGDCVVVDGRGREVGRFATGARLVLGAGIDVLPNRRVLVPHFTDNKVVEYGPGGEVLWEASVREPASAQRLPGGSTLVASTTTREVVEVDRAGRVAWKISTSMAPVFASRSTPGLASAR